MTEIWSSLLKPQAEEIAVKYSLQGQSRMTQVSFEPQPCRLPPNKYGALNHWTTPSTLMQKIDFDKKN